MERKERFAVALEGIEMHLLPGEVPRDSQQTYERLQMPQEAHAALEEARGNGGVFSYAGARFAVDSVVFRGRTLAQSITMPYVEWLAHDAPYKAVVTRSVVFEAQSI